MNPERKGYAGLLPAAIQWPGLLWFKVREASGARASLATLGAEWFTAPRFAVFLGVLIVVTFSAVLVGGQTFITRDYSLFSYPVAFFFRRSFWQGNLPLWNPYSHCGLPFLAQWNTMALYPPSLIYLVLPLNWSLSFFTLLHLFWGGLGMYFLAHRWTGDRLAAALAGVVISFNGLMLNFLMWPSHAATFSWLPWVIWLTPMAWREGGRKLVWAAGAGTLQMLAGGPETIMATWLILALLAALDWFKNRGARKQVPLRFLGVVLLVGMLSAAQLGPFLQLLANSQRDASYAGAGSANWCMPIWGWVNLLVPLFWAVPSPQGVCFQVNQFWTSSYYIGIGPLLLALVAAHRAGHNRVVLLAGLSLLGLFLALGDQGFLYQALRRLVPALGFVRYAIKYVIIPVALAPLLAAFGLKVLTKDMGKLGRFERCCSVGMLVLIAALGGLAYVCPLTEGLGVATLENAAGRGIFLLVSVLLLSALLKAQGSRRVLLSYLLLLSVWLDLATHTPNQNPSATPAVYSAELVQSNRNWNPPPRLGESRAMISPYAEAMLRTHQLAGLEENFVLGRLALLADCNLLEEVPQTFGFFSLVPEEIHNLTVTPMVQTNREFTPLLDFMGVGQVIAPGTLHNWTQRTSAMPLVTAGQRAFFVDEAAAYEAVTRTNINLRRLVLLPSEAEGSICATQNVAARVLRTEFQNQRVTVQAEAPAPAMVVLSQTYYPAWHARVDGQPVKLWRANYAFQALQMPAGNHRIELVYEDKAFHFGLLLSGLGLMICLAIWWRAHFRGQPVSISGLWTSE